MCMAESETQREGVLVCQLVDKERKSKLVTQLQSMLGMLRSQEGQDVAEYALLMALVALACVVAVGVFGDAVADLYSRINEGLPF